ncbi:MAG TPA: hypothetical protein VEO18_01190 [Thermoplasmata archaeon]|nr:hypothetical protein [Thermoplasmata archaeon]
MNLFRPRYLALIFAAYFGVIGYYAVQAARRASSGAYSTGISTTIYQTTMVGGVLVLIGIFITASISPHIKGGPPSRSTANPKTGLVTRRIRGDSARTSTDYRANRPAETAWPDADDFLEDPSDLDRSGYRDLEQAQDAAAVSAALSRLVPTGEPSAAGTLAERLSGMRARSSAVLVSEGKETAGVLLRLVNDMKPLLAAAKKVGLDLPELRRLVAEAAAGHEADLSQRVRLVEQVKGTLEAALVERIAESLQRVLLDIERMKSATQQVHAAEMTAAEAVALLDTGNYAGAVDRAEKAREILETHVVALPSRLEAASAPSSFVALAGPAFVAVAFVAASSMLLPAVDGFLLANRELNTAAILTLSYGWFGLIMYALMSVYYVMRPASTKPSAMERIARRQ